MPRKRETFEHFLLLVPKTLLEDKRVEEFVKDKGVPTDVDAVRKMLKPVYRKEVRISKI